MSACGPKKETDAQDSHGSRNVDEREEFNEGEGKESPNSNSKNAG